MKNISVFASSLALLTIANTVNAVTLTFDEEVSMVHGRVITNQYSGITISAENFNTSHSNDYAVLYNTTPGKKSNGGPADKKNDRDKDLTGGTSGKSWSQGNLASSNPLMGNALIIQENRTINGRNQAKNCNTGVCKFVDDEEKKPAGNLIFDFDYGISEFGLDVIDFNSGTINDYLASFYDSTGTQLGSIGFDEFIARDNADYGNNSINRISPINFLADLGITDTVSRIVLKMGGSGAIDNLVFNSVKVPEPGTWALLSFGAAWLFRRRFVVKR